MDWQNLLFSFNGRIRRSHYWLAAIGSGVAIGVVAGVILTVTGAAASMAGRGGGGPMATIGILLYCLILALAVYIGLALQVKRWHDRDKSWVWIFITVIPLIGAIWALVELGFLDGTQGPNKYGPSPKGIAGPAPAV
jgi:uncharacterized membrane protein YhaH (DUF805 family)